VDAADSAFNEVQLVIHAYSADWLYQVGSVGAKEVMHVRVRALRMCAQPVHKACALTCF